MIETLNFPGHTADSTRFGGGDIRRVDGRWFVLADVAAALLMAPATSSKLFKQLRDDTKTTIKVTTRKMNVIDADGLQQLSELRNLGLFDAVPTYRNFVTWLVLEGFNSWMDKLDS